MDYYAILGVRKRASERKIRKRYEKLTKKFDPSHKRNRANPCAAQVKLNSLKQAYSVLGNPAKRREYDLSFIVKPQHEDVKKYAVSLESVFGGIIDTPAPPQKDYSCKSIAKNGTHKVVILSLEEIAELSRE
jgi:curved DNA-binding protein CbpA